MSFTDSGAGTIVLGSTQTDQIGTAGPGGSFTDSNAGTIILGATESDQLTTTVVGAAPSVSSVTPNSGPVNTSIIIRGANFTAANSVRFTAAGLPATSAIFTVISATQINATVPSFAIGVADIVVTTPNGTSAIVPGDQFTITSAPLPGPAPIVLESLVLDPSAVAINRTQFDITPYVGSAGPDWGNAEVNQYLAEAGQYGQTAIDFKVPNRVVTIPLTLQDRGLGMTFEQVRANFQKKVGLFQIRGGWMKRSTVVGNVYAEIVGASLKLGGSTAQATQGVDQDAVLTLITLPDWYGDEITLGTQTCTNTSKVTIPSVKGDFPGRVRIRLVSTSIQFARLIWGMRSVNATGVSATQLTTFDSTTVGTTSGTRISGSGTGALSSQIISCGPIAALADICSFSTTLAGDYRVWVRAKSAQASGNTSMNVVWGPNRPGIRNTDAFFASTIQSWQLLDLGSVSMQPLPTLPSVGPYCQFDILASSNTNDTVLVDQVYLIPLDDGGGSVTSNPFFMQRVGIAELRTDGAFVGGIGTPVQQVIGDLPRLPVTGMETYPVEIFLRPNASLIEDTTPINYTAQVIYSPCYLVVPES